MTYRWADLPNWLTLLRLVLCAVYVFCTAVPWSLAWTGALVLFIVASLTDWLDGTLARAWKVTSPLGKLLDPLADKILVMAALISLIPVHVVEPWLVVTILAREFLITGLRTLAALHQEVMAADTAGKWKTAAQMTAIIVSLVRLSLQEWGVGNPFGTFLAIIEPYLFILALIITVVSGGLYVMKHRAMLK